MGGRMKVFIPGPMPGRNEQEKAARSHYHAAASMKKKWTNHCARFFEAKDLGKVDIECLFAEKNKRRDPDNISSGAIKYILDGMIKAGALKNDGWKQINSLTFDFIVDKDNPGVYVRARGVEKCLNRGTYVLKK